MNLSFWEVQSWLRKVNFTIVGSGIVGLSCALKLKEKFPKANILVLERGMLPQGASTKNAGFACFGSLSEILDDLETHSETAAVNLITKRLKGLDALRQNVPDSVMHFQQLGGYEVFTNDTEPLYNKCLSQIDTINNLLFPLFKKPVFTLKTNTFGFKNTVNNLIFNPFEGQIDTGRMMAALLKKAQIAGINILNNVPVNGFTELADGVAVHTENFTFNTNKLFIATNGFASELLNEAVKPARAQVLITKPIPNLAISGTFHLDRGFYYFRNVQNRILLGGGRNLDFDAEETTEMGVSSIIQSKLEELLHTIILPNTPFEIAQRWSGIMGVGSGTAAGLKEPCVKQVSNHVFCGVRLGGMGVAIGSTVGQELAELLQ
ncbi:NAD(P)/FAD-dependent oxidoreductase [Bizionia sediminis]|uniref:NAD(P)/FAD-dependent oxidoreductase n=1 Tax=Bizionia sediminis TaxID=1737064 RepID=A0ABW5KR23_9FLAO